MTKHYDQRKAANERYLAKLVQIQLRVSPELKEEIRAHADAHDGGSVNAFITRAIMEAMENDNKKPEA